LTDLNAKNAEYFAKDAKYLRKAREDFLCGF